MGIKQHSTITDPDIHEPKGVAAASASQIYMADGAGSGTWRSIPHGFCYYDNIGVGTAFVAPVAYTLINVATTGGTLDNVSHNSLGRLTYTGAETMDFHISGVITIKHSVGAGNDCYFSVYKNGVAVAGGQVVESADSTTYSLVPFLTNVSLATNDYIEVYCKVAAGNITVHSFNMDITGHL